MLFVNRKGDLIKRAATRGGTVSIIIAFCLT